TAGSGPSDRRQGPRSRSRRAGKRGYQGSSIACPNCQGGAKFQRWQAKAFLSAVGEVRLERAYYYRPHCRQGCCPWEQTLGLCRAALTPAARELTCLAGILSSFEEAGDKVLPRMAGLRVSASTVQRVTERAGADLAGRLRGGETFGPPAPG